MKLFVEGYQYESDIAKNILKDFEPIFTSKTVSSGYVGYCYSKELNDCIFFLPKVICDVKDEVFGQKPENIIDIQKSSLKEDQKQFIGGLGVWIYRALKEFSLQAESSKIIKNRSFSLVGTGERTKNTYLDILLSIKKFYEENKDFFIFTIKNIHSQQHKINWQKTISHTTPIIQEGTPLYLNPISKKKTIDWDEELLTIFFSILEHMNRYGFGITLNVNYNLIKGEKFQAYLDGLGLTRLRQIQHKYFSDKTRQLWSLCYSFFEKAEEISSSKQDSDFLMATKFNIVFESMVDNILGDPNYDNWKKLGDGKVIDHIYKDHSLFSPDNVFFIGDSKYYKTSLEVGESSESTYKQFTYARTIVSDSIHKSMGNTWPYRDKLTEGYTVTPNFFISAETDKELKYETDGLDNQYAEGNPYIVRQFSNRLFDRDTLWVKQYNLNFLYLLSVYASADVSAKALFKKKARRFFREKTIDLLNQKYEFSLLTPKNGEALENVMVDEVKWGLRGLCYRQGKDSNSLVLAMEIPEETDANTREDVLMNNGQIKEDQIRVKFLIKDKFDVQRIRLCKNNSKEIELIPTQEITDRKNGFFAYYFNA